MEKPKLHFEKVVLSQESHEREKSKLEKATKLLKLVEKINESNERIPFPGIHPEVYSRMKKDEEEFLDCVTPIDEIIKRCEEEGIKVVIGKNPESSNVFVLPADSTDIEMDSIPSYWLMIDAVKDERFRELIQLTKESQL